MNPPDTQSLTGQFRQTYGRAPTVIARAPGRIEFVGNHTDYNGGAVLALTGDAFTEQDVRGIAWRHGTAGHAAPEWLRLHSVDGARVLWRR